MHDPPVLAVLGDLLEDVVVWSPGPAQPATDNPAIIHRCRGGSAANVAEFAAPHVATRFLGRVGDDPLGAALCDQLTTAGVDVRVQRHGRTGCIVVMVDPTGERTMFPDRGASAELAAAPLTWIDGVSALHVTAYAFATATSAHSAMELVRALASRSGITAIDTSSTTTIEGYGVQHFRALMRELRPAVLFANAEEARLLGLRDSDVPPGTTIVVKDGAAPTTVLDARGAHHIAVPPIPDIRDTTGAGDAFAAGYLAAVLAGAPSVDAVTHAHTLAAQVLATPGAQAPPQPKREVT